MRFLAGKGETLLEQDTIRRGNEDDLVLVDDSSRRCFNDDSSVTFSGMPALLMFSDSLVCARDRISSNFVIEIDERLPSVESCNERCNRSLATQLMDGPFPFTEAVHRISPVSRDEMSRIRKMLTLPSLSIFKRINDN